MTASLTDLERKLVDLERQLNLVAGGSVVASASAPALPAPPADTRDSSLRVEDLRGEIADLVRFRDQLESAARELVTEYDRLVARLRPAGPAESPPAVAAGMPSGAPVAAQQTPRQSDAQHGETSFVGAVVVDAGPFADITTLQAFEQALARVEGAEEVYVRSFEGDRALIDVRLSNPVPLAQVLRNQLPWPINAIEAGNGRLSVDVVATDHHGI